MQYQWNSSEEKCAYVLNAAKICLFILIIHLGYRSNHSCLSLWHLMMIGGDKGVCEIYSGNFSDWVACGLRKTARQAAVYFCSKSLKKTLLGVCLEIDWRVWVFEEGRGRRLKKKMKLNIFPQLTMEGTKLQDGGLDPRWSPVVVLSSRGGAT